MFRQPKPVNQRPGILGHHVSLTQGFLRAYAEVGECSGTKSTLTAKGHVATASMNPLLHSFDVFDRCVTTFEQNLWLGWPACFNLDRHGFDESEQSIRAFCGSARVELGHHGCPNAPVLVSNTCRTPLFGEIDQPGYDLEAGLSVIEPYRRKGLAAALLYRAARDALA
jgi:hypothetical protein